MSKRITSLDRIHIESPCSADWDSMKGNEQVRFCEHCRLSVHNLSEMTRHEALRLVQKSNGRLCVRYVSRREDRDKPSALPIQLYRVTRRASRVAASAFTAVLSMAAAAAAQTSSAGGEANIAGVAAPIPAAQENNSALKSGLGGTLFGTIKDQGGQVVAGAKVTIRQLTNRMEQFAFSNAAGEYSFQSLPDGLYQIEAVAPRDGRPSWQTVLPVSAGAEKQYDMTLVAGAEIEISEGTLVTAGSVSVVTPSLPLVAAAADDDIDAVKELLFKGADVDEVDRAVDATALDEAVMRGKLEMVLALIDAGADVNRRNNYGRTALMFLTDDTSPEVARALIKAGAKVNLKDEDGETALMMAAERFEDGAIVELLLEEKAEVNAVSKSGKTALMKAAEEGHTASVRALIDAGAEVNARDADGESALKKAIDNNQRDAAQLLISFGADEDATTEDESAKN
jgi:ankyrin repeat protein